VTVIVRDATAADAAAIVGLVAELADSEDWPLELTEAYVPTYLTFPGARVLLAESGDRAVGLLAYCVRPGLFHAGDIGSIDELVVAPSARRTGVATRLLQTAMRRMAEWGCKEISLSTGFDNAEAQRLYRSLGLTEESLLLEKHLQPPG
jgi:ribosomal protein S18 acetylase RimI-like enzyme